MKKIIDVGRLQEFLDLTKNLLTSKADKTHTHTYDEILEKNGYEFCGVKFIDNGTDFEATRLGLAKDATITENTEERDELGNIITKKISSFDSLYPWSKMRRVIVDNNLNVVDVYGSATFDDTLSSHDYAPHTHAVMVEIPKFYSRMDIEDLGENKQEVKISISKDPIPGFTVDPMFLKANADGSITECHNVYVRAYEGILCKKADGTFPFVNAKDDESDKTRDLNDFAFGKQEVTNADLYMLASVNAKNKQAPTTATNMSNFRKMAECRNTNKFFTQYTYNIHFGIVKLFLVEFASMNSQQVLGDGVANLPWNNNHNAVTVGFTSVLGNASGNVTVTNIKRGSDEIYTCKIPSYRGMENLWGNVWKFVEGAKTGKTGQIKYGIYNPHNTNDYSKYDDNTFGMQQETTKVFEGNKSGYWKTFVEHSLFAPKIYKNNEVIFDSSSSKYHGDYVWFNSSNGQILLLGGNWGYGANCGLFFSGWVNGFCNSSLNVGSALVGSK